MGKKLYLLRHAKSDWSNLALSDRDRPLNRRGEAAATLIGARLAAEGFTVDQVICSPAQRAVQTLERLVASGGFNFPVTYDDCLYGAGASRLLSIIHKQNDAADSLMLVGHNPGLEELALAISMKRKTKLIGKVRKKVPTGSLISLEFDLDSFSKIGASSGCLVGFRRPKHEFLLPA
jgi:phosphohistidine phosphatase